MPRGTGCALAKGLRPLDPCPVTGGFSPEILAMKSETKRTKRIEIAVTDEELLALHQRKTKPRLAEWMREVALGEKVNRKQKIKPVDPKLLYELNKIGVNLNQIAHYCNVKKSDTNLIEVALLLRNIEQRLRAIENVS